MKLKVLRAYTKAHKMYLPGDEIEVEPRAGANLIKHGLAVEIDQEDADEKAAPPEVEEKRTRETRPAAKTRKKRSE